MQNHEILCFACHKPTGLQPNQKIPKSEECYHCYASLRCCKMCSFYDQSSYNECKEPMADRIVDKDKANFCDFFKLKSDCKTKNNEKEDLLEKANSLFKNS